MSLLALDALTVDLGPSRVLEGVSLSVSPGEVLGLIGPNGAGKTTLMRAALGLVPHHGRSSLARLAAEPRARAAAWLPQTREIAWPVTVEHVVGLGRLPHRAGRAEDARAVADALDRMGLSGFRERVATRLSGGEQARVLLARALAQEAPLLMADEPIAGLDPGHQLDAMHVFADLAREGRGVVVALHDLGLAARFCDRLALLSRGRLAAIGPPADVLSEGHMAQVFGLRAGFVETPHGPVFHVAGRL
ncbi:MAG: ABC transporter ATP-binding protein [Rhodobacteraceae bacterium]|nr:ABC transporter ATP-binding protein [Paracoccaceae bacterium]